MSASSEGENLGSGVRLLSGDNLAILPTLAENSIDSVVTDPPYHLTSIVKRFSEASETDNTITSERVRKRSDGYARLVACGFMGSKWDGGDIAFRPETWAAVYRVLKPGGHMLVFGGTRTYHRLACAIEDAGFEIRDAVMWHYGSGFPKSHNVSKAIDKASGVEFEELPACGVGFMGPDRPGGYNRTVHQLKRIGFSTNAAKQWEGYGTALKPATEIVCLARKPLSESTVAANVLKWGTGALNIDGCKIGTSDDLNGGRHRGVQSRKDTELVYGSGINKKSSNQYEQPSGRWPANVAHDGSDEVLAGFPNAPGQLAAVGPENGAKKSVNCYGDYGPRAQVEPRGDSGFAARFFYSSKADADDRLGSSHPTVKPVDLIQWLCRLITPPGGTVLDPFAGTGTTGEAAIREGFKAVLIEREQSYCADIRRRIKLTMAGPDERARESIKARGKTESPGPLFDCKGYADG